MHAPHDEKRLAAVTASLDTCEAGVGGSNTIDAIASINQSFSVRKEKGKWQATPLCNTGVEHGRKQALNGVGVDWVTFASDHKLGKVCDVLTSSSIGGKMPDWEPASAAHGYLESARDPDSRWRIFYGRAADEDSSGLDASVMLQVSGKGCSQMGLQDTYTFSQDIMGLLGIKCTRIDFCVDLFQGTGSGLIDKAHKACQSGLCHRNGHVISNHDRRRPGKLGKVTGDTLYMGSLKSEIYGRWYDKGLETQTAAEGEWVRLEVQFKKGRANQAAIDMVLEGQENAHRHVLSHTMGSFQFGTPARPSGWFSGLLSSLEAGVSVVPSMPITRDCQKWLNWQGATNSPILRYHAIAQRLTEETGQLVTAGQVLDRFFPYMCAAGRKVNDKVTRDLADLALVKLSQANCYVGGGGI